ncbi:MAG: phosphoglycerate dehydrogenase [Alphaproteobacteria bacterium]|jgi:D-3-phosphoglycerate dehydrogenase|nr:phosphoglycerate dehydrogenase [Alphaproteobacteria bacterium]
MPKVLISDKLSPLAAEVFRNRGIEVDEAPGLDAGTLLERIADCDGLAIRSATKVAAEVLAAAKQLRVVGRAGIGVDNVDVPAATANGVVVMNTPFGNSVTTAEHAVAMMMALARRIPQADASTRSGKWEKSRFMGVELAGKTLGLIGCGNIGSIVADRAQGLKMRVIAYDPYMSGERAAELALEKVEFDALLARADIISLHTPLSDSTRNILDAAALAKTRKGVRIVNCARGGLVNEADLAAAIETGHVAGAALDVFETEPVGESPLFAFEQVIATPHLGASTSEAQEKVAVQVAEQMADYLLDGAVTNALNMPSVTAEEAPKLEPYMVLARQLGGFAGQITESGITSVSLQFEGHATTLNCRPVTAVVLQGLLAPQLEGVNMVNAPLIAKEREINVREILFDGRCDYHTLVSLTVTTERRTRSISGTLLGERPRITEIEGIAMDAGIGTDMLYIKNRDQPGMVGAFAKMLGDAGINIATFHLGRSEAGGEAMALVEIDQEVPTDLLVALRALDGVVQAKSLKF